jgi:hypothetical protein
MARFHPFPESPMDLSLALVTIGGGGLLLDATQPVERDRSVPAFRVDRAPRPGSESATPALPRTFDAIFARHGQGVPVAYLRALAWHESRLIPTATSRTTSATGLFQVLDVVRNDHNRLHGTAYTRDDLHDPVINVTIAAAALRRIAMSYARSHRTVPNLIEDWNNYRFVELLTSGWNAGWSERAGVGRVARYLEALGTTDVTIELIQQHARAAGATEHLQSAAKLRWSRQVARQYAAERVRDHQEGYAPAAPMIATVPDAQSANPAGAAPVSSPSQVG